MYDMGWMVSWREWDSIDLVICRHETCLACNREAAWPSSFNSWARFRWSGCFGYGRLLECVAGWWRVERWWCPLRDQQSRRSGSLCARGRIRTSGMWCFLTSLVLKVLMISVASKSDLMLLVFPDRSKGTTRLESDSD